MIITAASNSYLLLLKMLPTKAAFLKRTRVRTGTYAEELMEDVYDDIFRRSKDLRREYEKYYAVEYLAFSAFMRNFRGIPSGFLTKADQFFRRYKHIISYQPVHSFLNDDEGIQLLARILNCRIQSL